MMGYDTKYSTILSDSELLDAAKKEDRILLTRDFALYQQGISKGVKTFYVEGETESKRLSELAGRFGISLAVDMRLSRCPKCNTALASVPKKEIATKVEKNTFLHYNDFWQCPKCEAVYWQGAHWTKICSILQEAKELLENKKSRA
jgi:uncharacterized protein with PIN domain